MNLPVTPIREMCEKVIAFNVSPLVADEYKKNVVTIALRAYHFIFQANTLSQKPLSDLLIEPYGLEGYSNREIGELFGVPANYVTAWVAKARKVLKRQRDYEYSGALS